MKTCAIRIENVSKSFGSVMANKNISLSIYQGEILSLLGENGSGKTTLMNMLSGIYFPDAGQIYIDEKPVVIKSPKDAFDNGIGMIHQHFKLVNVMTAAENIILGLKGKAVVDLSEVAKTVEEINAKYGFNIDPYKKVYDMSVSEKQTLEIVKVLYRGANILILDEPTAVLTPQEIDNLFDILRKMKEDGKSIIIITHKLNEVMAIADRVAVLRKGEYVGEKEISETNPTEMTSMMMGHYVELNINRTDSEISVKRLEVKDLTVYDSEGVLKLDHLNFDVFGGEILGIAGISGSGQKELLESLAGLVKTQEGEAYYLPKEGERFNLLGKSPKEIKDAGVLLSFVPEDRLGMGLVGSMGMVGNVQLRTWKDSRGVLIHDSNDIKIANTIKQLLSVETPGINYPVRRLSGGNVQKVLVGREIIGKPTLLMTAYAVRGLDVNTSYAIYDLLLMEKSRGTAVLYVGEDVDVLLQLCNRIMVMYNGKITGIVDARVVTKEQIGLMMTGSTMEEVLHEH